MLIFLKDTFMLAVYFLASWYKHLSNDFNMKINYINIYIYMKKREKKTNKKTNERKRKKKKKGLCNVSRYCDNIVSVCLVLMYVSIFCIIDQTVHSVHVS